ncbi:AAA family ATPase [Brevibacillus centrosporus]|jgi:deoxyadenosine/deoxycytidine kinase|uniref:AAA family ATPase n=1 Tax=Brevibacillus centrosporus TaxID=54910 RepID=UPI002E1D7677|nr:AAA family ATPase [Brevibacillus centrosporus]
MKRVISLQGGMAAGKTTLAKRLEKAIRDAWVIYEDPSALVQKRKELALDLQKEKDFIVNQRMFIEHEVERFRRLPDANIIYDRGPEDIECYTLHYPLSIGKEWDIEGQLKAELKELRSCRSDAIIYLDAQAKTLSARKEGDATRSRGSFAQAMRMLSYEKEWFSRLPATTVLPVDALDVETVEARVLPLIANLWKD